MKEPEPVRHPYKMPGLYLCSLRKTLKNQSSVNSLYTQEWVAKHSGTSRQFIGDLEAGKQDAWEAKNLFLKYKNDSLFDRITEKLKFNNNQVETLKYLYSLEKSGKARNIEDKIIEADNILPNTNPKHISTKFNYSIEDVKLIHYILSLA